MAKKPVRLVGSGKCQIADDSDDEELSDTLNKQAETTNVEDSGDEAVTAPTFSTDDEEEEAVATPPPAPKKKKKVVRRKKAAQ
jgi:hypothetical protein